MLNWYFVAILIALALAGFFYLDQFFIRLVERCHEQCSIAVRHFFRMFSFTPFVIIALYVIPIGFVFFYLDTFSAAALTLACLLATGSAFVLKYIFKRVRPLGHTTYLGKVDSAFPSAHTAGSFVAAFTVAIFWPAWSIPLFMIASLVAASRMYLELHFFSDVMGGILLAYLMMNLALDSTLLTFLGF
ncbi:MAG: phosphatase PAP2 family protein [Patescibacteria group bacterium]